MFTTKKTLEVINNDYNNLLYYSQVNKLCFFLQAIAKYDFIIIIK